MSICQIILSQGKNKGLMCGQVNNRCRHHNNVCDACGKNLATDTSLINHRKICTLSKKIRPNIAKRTTNRDLKELEQRLENLLDEKIKSVEKVTINNNNTINHTVNNTVNINLTTIGSTDALQNLVERMGQKEALTFLLNITTSSRNQLMSIMEQMYLTGDPNNYPIANKDGNIFRFRDIDQRIIHDIGGKKIAKLSSNIHRNLYASAANLEAQHFIEKGDNYDKYYIMQECASNNKHDTKNFVKDLANKTYNPDHHFFAKGTPVVIDD